MRPPLPPALRAVIDEDLGRIRGELKRLAPDAGLVLAGSLAFDEPWASRGADGGWRLESDYDIYLLVPRPGRAVALARDPRLRGLAPRLGTRAQVDPLVVWRPLAERGISGMVGRDMESGAFMTCRLDPRRLQVNQLRKALLRGFVLAPRETPERARYQIVKATIEALRAIILANSPGLSPQALFSIRANQRWLRSHASSLEPGDAELLDPLLTTRLDLRGPGLNAALPDRAQGWLSRFARTRAAGLLPRPGSFPTPTGTRTWLSLLRQGLLPDPRLDYDRELLGLLSDPLTTRLASDPSVEAALEARWSHLSLLPVGAPRPGALLRALDGALSHPGSTRGERYLSPPEPGP